MRDVEIAHGSAVKMLDRSVQAVYKMKDLAMELATEEGENRVLRRLQTIDMARGLLNSITIDNEGEDYDFRTFQFAGVSDIINATCNYLSALTSIPQTILFGRSPAGMNATGESDMEIYYNFVERIQKRSLRSNLRYLLSVIFQAGVATGEIEKVPNINVQFNPLWSMSDAEKADLELKNAQAKQTKAATATLYIQEQVLSAEEVRKSLVKSGDFDVDATFDDDEDEESMAEMIQKITENGGFAPNSGGSSPDAAPAATKLPQDMNDGDLAEASVANAQSEQDPTIGLEAEKTDDAEAPAAGKGNLGSVGVLVIKDGKILVSVRKHDVGNGLICGPGGHIEPGETPIMAAARETSEEFGIIPNELIPIGNGPAEPETGYEPYIFLCTDYDGEPVADDDEMSSATFMSLEELEELSSALFAPFADSLKFLLNAFGGEDRKDAAGDDIDWITINGTHVPLDDEGNAVGGGKLKGKNFSNAKSSGKAEKSSTAGKAFSPVKKYEALSKSASEIKESGKSKEEKAAAYKKMVKDVEPGTTFKINGMECRKSDDPDYPIEVIDFEGKTINSYRNMDFDLEYYADKENCLVFFDKEAEVAERKKTAAAMKKSGEFHTSDSVHGERPGKITESSSNFGEEGDYVVYRNGSIGSSGMIFFSPKKEGADSYASLHDSGNTGEYEVHLKNPLVINGTTDVECIKQAYEKLHPGKTLKGPLTSSKWISCDKANASALNSGVGGYDSIVYVLNGEPHEVQVSAKKAKRDVAKTGEYTTTKWSRSGYTYEEAAVRGMISEGAEDYKRVDSNTDGFGDDGVHCSTMNYDSILKSISANRDGGQGSGNFGHEGRPGEVGGSAPGDGSPATPDAAKEVGRCLMKITKRRFNDGVAKLVEESGYKATDEGRKKVMDMLDEFEPGSTITYPERGAYGEKVAFIKQEDGTWRAFGADYSADEIADDFFETEDRRPVASKSAESKEERDYYSALSQKANWRNNEQIWKKDGSFSKTTEIKLQKTDLDHAGIGMKVVGNDGTEYEKLENGWYKAGTYEKADMRKIGHPKIQADFFTANFGLNGISVDECARMRELYDGMPDKLRTQYEATFRTAEFAPALRGCSYCSQSTGRIYFDMDSSAETILHETAHAFDKGVINKDADVGNGFGTVHISSASQNIDFILDYQDGRNDFEAMAKVVGISTNGEGWFSQELQDDSSARISAFVKFSGKYESMEDFECVSDAISGMTLDMMGESFLGGGHSQSYWQQPYGGEMASNQSCEYWANFCTLMAKGNTRALTLLKDISPARYAACLKTYEEAFGDE